MILYDLHACSVLLSHSQVYPEELYKKTNNGYNFNLTAFKPQCSNFWIVK